MTLNQKLEYIANNKIIETIARNCGVASQYIDDLRQDIFLSLGKDKNFKRIPQEQIIYYLVRIIKNQWFSKTSYLYKAYRRPLIFDNLRTYEEQENEDDNDDEQE